MKGSIRIVVGFLIVLGAVGAEDYALEMMQDPPHLLQTLGLAVIGLGLMFSGANAMKENV